MWLAMVSQVSQNLSRCARPLSLSSSVKKETGATKKFTFSFRSPPPSSFELAFHLAVRRSRGAGVVTKNRCHGKSNRQSSAIWWSVRSCLSEVVASVQSLSSVQEHDVVVSEYRVFFTSLHTFAREYLLMLDVRMQKDYLRKSCIFAPCPQHRI